MAYPGILSTKGGEVIEGEFRFDFNPNADGLAIYLSSDLEMKDGNGQVVATWPRKSFTFWSQNGYPYTIAVDDFKSFKASVNA